MWKRFSRWVNEDILYATPRPMPRREFIISALFLMTARKALCAAAVYVLYNHPPAWAEPSAEGWREVVWVMLSLPFLAPFFLGGWGLLRNRLAAVTDSYSLQLLPGLALLVYFWKFDLEAIAYDPLHALLQAAVLAVFALLPEKAIPDASQKPDSRETLET